MSQQEIDEAKAIVARKLAAGAFRRTYSVPGKREPKNNGVLSQTKDAIHKRAQRARDAMSQD